MSKKVAMTSLLSIVIIIGLVKLFPETVGKTYAIGTSLAQTVITGASTGETGACAAGENGVCATNSYTAEDDSIRYHDYRYRGAEPNNYVRFNDDLYRIIGVFDDYTHGVEGQYLVKLIRSRILNDLSWGINSDLVNKNLGTYLEYRNDWTGNRYPNDETDNTSPANANILLNEYFYNKTNNSDIYGSCSNWTFYHNGNDYKTYSCTDIVGFGLDSTYRNYVQKATWHLRGYRQSNGNTKQSFYLCERGEISDTTCRSESVYEYNVETIENIGLMYVSDYLYASSYESDADISLTGSSSYFGNKNWLYKGDEWMITPSDNNAIETFYVEDSGEVFNGQVYYSKGIRPTFYLKSSVYVTGGTGTFDDPYTIACDDCDS